MWRLILIRTLLLFFLLVATSILFPVDSVAQCNTALDQGCEGPPPGPSGAIELKNPLKDINDIGTFLKQLIDIAIIVGIPIAVLFIIYTGFLFVSAQGKPEKLRDARRALLAVVIGVAILLGAWVIATAIKGTIDAIRGGP